MAHEHRDVFSPGRFKSGLTRLMGYLTRKYDHEVDISDALVYGVFRTGKHLELVPAPFWRFPGNGAVDGPCPR